MARVLIGGEGTGQNPFNNIRSVLAALNVTANNKAAHHNHFHIYMRAPTRVDITQNLLAENNVGQAESELSDAMRIAAQVLLDEIQPQLNLNQGDINMLFMDVPPDVPVMYAPVVIAQATQAKDATKLDRTIGVCQLINSLTGDIGRDPQSLIYVIVPVLTVSDYINRFEKRFVGLEGKATLLQGAAHGTVKDEGDQYYRYVPNLNYLGSDRATFLVEIGGLKVKVVYHLKVINGGAIGGTEADDKQNCPNGMFWKISSTLAPNGNLIVTSVEYQSPTLSDMAATLGASLFGDTSDITLNIADLPSGAVGQTVGNTITLDTAAAGYNWFIDTTPSLNEEYLPTADANIWQARAGSDAAGKMDMLSVLLHEYGHVLGIEHSADQHAAMATTLTPGTRRLPNADELASRIIGDIPRITSPN